MPRVIAGVNLCRLEENRPRVPQQGRGIKAYCQQWKLFIFLSPLDRDLRINLFVLSVYFIILEHRPWSVMAEIQWRKKIQSADLAFGGPFRLSDIGALTLIESFA